ncbi:ethanolamine ammonia-lyase reactivating factor EutA [Haloarcula salina]|uniref:Ethanolamine ammonia-lyase reactivating factor EutA n=1 Tax=Haloarcula salina TaxID=1429914 RepID=A0AA41KJC7_9EURY|nr:ethanolamine ammonia-lyase reactivating factor EutA [Haloarcula salina]MBV0903731.1 ethanolamine ammonia-lyase reactivating factor EutA [Haloarcula salina]
MERDAAETLCSVGIDVGTTTTQVVVSDLTLQTPAVDGAASVEVLDRTVHYRSPIRETPYADASTIDTDEVLAFVDRELRKAGRSPADIDTGAVIATGAAAKTRNAEPLVDRLAERSGEFVVATAGAAYEAVLAGRGAGAVTRSQSEGTTVATVDIGGGTTNVAVFVDGTARQTRCIDVGGRDVQFDRTGTVASVADSVRDHYAAAGALSDGAADSPATHRRLASWQADRILDCVEGPPFDPTTEALAIGPLPSWAPEIDEVRFTGGVGRLVADGESVDRDPYAFDDLGVRLAAALRDHPRFDTLPVRESATDIRATVVGVGTHTTTFSGRTIAVDASVLPVRDLPVVAVGGLDAAESAAAIQQRTAQAIETARDGDAADEFALCFPSIGPLTYDRVSVVAEGIAAAYAAAVGEDCPLVALTGQNCAKVLGQTLAAADGSRPTIVVDELELDGAQYVDLGAPVANGTAVPATLKTLVFDE